MFPERKRPGGADVGISEKYRLFRQKQRTFFGMGYAFNLLCIPEALVMIEKNE